MSDVRRLPVGEDDEVRVTLDDLAREGARRIIAAALEAEVREYVSTFIEEVGEDGKRLVVRNGHAQERKVTVGSGTVSVRAPRVTDKRLDERTGTRPNFVGASLTHDTPAGIDERLTHIVGSFELIVSPALLARACRGT
jgi:hypothetical protein